MKTIKGNLVNLALCGEFDVIIHGCNCFCTMGAGIAKQIRERLPYAYTVDAVTDAGDKSKLGGYTSAITFFTSGHEITVINAYTQYRYDGRKQGKIDVDYDAIRSAFKKLSKEYPDKRIGYPLIGAGLAGGDWDIISKIIDEELEGLNHTLVEYDG